MFFSDIDLPRLSGKGVKYCDQRIMDKIDQNQVAAPETTSAVSDCLVNIPDEKSVDCGRLFHALKTR